MREVTITIRASHGDFPPASRERGRARGQSQNSLSQNGYGRGLHYFGCVANNEEALLLFGRGEEGIMERGLYNF